MVYLFDPNVSVLSVEQTVVIASMALGLVFAYAAGLKLLDLPGFISGIAAYRRVPNRFAARAGGVLVIAEITVAIAHIADIGLRMILPGAIAILSLFLVVTANSLIRGEKVACLCFGSSRDETISTISVIRIGLMLSAEIAVYFYLINSGGQEGLRAGPDPNIAAVSVSASTLILLINCCLSIPKIRRAFAVVRS
jgi:hypothetical protein